MTASGAPALRSPRHVRERPAVARVAGMVGVGVAAAAAVVASPSVLDPASQPRWVTMTPPPREAPSLELPRLRVPVPSAHPRPAQEPPEREERGETGGMPQSGQSTTPTPASSPTATPTDSPTATATSTPTSSPTATPTNGEPPPDAPSRPEETDPPDEPDQETSENSDEAADECLEPSLVDPEACPDPLGD